MATIMVIDDKTIERYDRKNRNQYGRGILLCNLYEEDLKTIMQMRRSRRGGLSTRAPDLQAPTHITVLSCIIKQVGNKHTGEEKY